MTDEEWEAWEEWIEHPLTRKFTAWLARKSDALREQWIEGLWANPSDPRDGAYPELRAQSEVYGELSDLTRDTIETLKGDVQ